MPSRIIRSSFFSLDPPGDDPSGHCFSFIWFTWFCNLSLSRSVRRLVVASIISLPGIPVATPESRPIRLSVTTSLATVVHGPRAATRAKVLNGEARHSAH